MAKKMQPEGCGERRDLLNQNIITESGNALPLFAPSPNISRLSLFLFLASISSGKSISQQWRILFGPLTSSWLSAGSPGTPPTLHSDHSSKSWRIRPPELPRGCSCLISRSGLLLETPPINASVPSTSGSRTSF